MAAWRSVAKRGQLGTNLQFSYGQLPLAGAGAGALIRTTYSSPSRLIPKSTRGTHRYKGERLEEGIRLQPRARSLVVDK